MPHHLKGDAAFLYFYLIKQHIVDRRNSLVGIVAVDDAGDLDLAGGDHLDVDVVVGQCLKHLGSNAAVALHTSTHDGDLGAGGVHTDIADPSCRHGRWTAG